MSETPDARPAPDWDESLRSLAREAVTLASRRLQPEAAATLKTISEEAPATAILALADILGGRHVDAVKVDEPLDAETGQERGLRLALELLRLAARETIDQNAKGGEPMRLAALATADAVGGLSVALVGMLSVPAPGASGDRSGPDGGQLIRAAVGALVSIVTLFDADLIERQLTEARAVAAGISLARRAPEVWPS